MSAPKRTAPYPAKAHTRNIAKSTTPPLTASSSASVIRRTSGVTAPSSSARKVRTPWPTSSTPISRVSIVLLLLEVCQDRQLPPSPHAYIRFCFLGNSARRGQRLCSRALRGRRPSYKRWLAVRRFASNRLQAALPPNVQGEGLPPRGVRHGSYWWKLWA